MYPSQSLRYSLMTMAFLLAMTAVLLAATGIMLALQGMPTTVLAVEHAPVERGATGDDLPTRLPLPSSAQAALALQTPRGHVARQPTQQPTRAATPTSEVAPGPARQPRARIGLQAGHWKIDELPDELANLRTASGAHVAGIAEPEVNLDIARRAAALLARQGVVVDVLPATVPPGYRADAFISLHCDGSLNPNPRGYKLATPWYASQASLELLEAVTAEYGSTTGLPQTYNITIDMRGYYAFGLGYHEHSIDSSTPAIIVEMGYLTNEADRALLVGNPDLVAEGLARGILRYLEEPR